MAVFIKMTAIVAQHVSFDELGSQPTCAFLEAKDLPSYESFVE